MTLSSTPLDASAFRAKNSLLPVALAALQKDEITDDEKFAIAVCAGVAIVRTGDGPAAKYTTAPCGFHRANGVWHVICDARQAPPPPRRGRIGRI